MSRRNASYVKTSSRIISAVISAVIVSSGVPAVVNAQFDSSKYQQQIKALEAEIGTFQGETSRLQSEAQTLENRIASLNIQIKTIETEIALHEAKRLQLGDQIISNQQQLDEQKVILADTLGKLYVKSSVSSLEMIAGSDTLGDFMDKQHYQTAIKNKLNSSIKQVKDTKKILESQKQEVERIVADQKDRNDQLALQKTEQAKLLEETRGQETAFQNLIGQRNAEVSEVKEEQAAAFAEYERKYQEELRKAEEARKAAEAAAAQRSRQNTPAPSAPAQVQQAAPAGISNVGIGNTYPAKWANPALDSVVDKWGMYNRECVSYTAWKVAESGRHMPHWGGRGNAYQWPANARGAGIPVSSSPRVGSVAVWGLEDIGGVGHVAYVEATYGDGSILISQYNWGVRGGYTEMRLPASLVRSLEFIHF